MTTFCEDCCWCERPFKGSPWYRWHCLRASKKPQEQFVVRDRWLTESPHKRCAEMNPEGTCGIFEKQEASDANTV